MCGNKRKLVVGVVRFGAGNLGNVERALDKLGIEHALLETSEDIKIAKPTLLMLPGVGAFKPAMENLSSSGWVDALTGWTAAGRPLLGVCLGMQLLCARSTEGGETDGLGLIDAEIRRLAGIKKIPHMGWNSASPCAGARTGFPASCMENGEQVFYFVHSYAVSASKYCAAVTCVDGVEFCSILRRDNVAGFQFHPERSGPDGVKFLGRSLHSFNEEYS
jgi:glutamine amidotransferase